MKYIFLILLSVYAIATKAQSDTLIVSSDYERSTELPLKAESGKIIKTYADTIFLFNRIRYAHYQELRELVRDSIGKQFEEMVMKYEKILTENDILFAELEKQCLKQSELYKKNIEDLNSSLSIIDKNLELTERSLNNANKSIELGLDQISKSQKNNFWKKFGILGGGISIGLVTGLLLSN